MKAYHLYTVVPRLLEFIVELSNWYLRLNRDRIKGLIDENETLIGLNVLLEVLNIMTVIMSPFTPFFSEFLYQHLRKFSLNYLNNDSTIPVDVFGKAESVHYLMLPLPDVTKLNVLAVNRFKVLQEVVTLVRILREKRKIRNNLPLKSVVIVSPNIEDIEALEFLKTYVLTETNSYELITSNEWNKMCNIKIQPNFQLLGKKLGSSMKSVAKLIQELKYEEILLFINTGLIEINGFTLTKEDIIIKREFNGDNVKYEAGVSEDGRLLVAIDTTIDETIINELRIRSFTSNVQKLRKQSNLNMKDKIEIFYDIEDINDNEIISQSLMKHYESTLKRIKILPINYKLKSKNSMIICSEIIKDIDISKSSVKLILTTPMIAVDNDLLKQLIQTYITQQNIELKTVSFEQIVQTSIDYIQTMDYDKVLSLETITMNIDGINLTVTKNIHYFSSVYDMLLNGDVSWKTKYPYLPTNI